MPDPAAERMYALSPAQREQLRLLWDAGCTTADTAREAVMLPGFELTRMQLLQRMGLVVIREFANRRPRYFLSPAGVAEVRKPSEARHD